MIKVPLDQHILSLTPVSSTAVYWKWWGGGVRGQAVCLPYRRPAVSFYRLFIGNRGVVPRIKNHLLEILERGGVCLFTLQHSRSGDITGNGGVGGASLSAVVYWK